MTPVRLQPSRPVGSRMGILRGVNFKSGDIGMALGTTEAANGSSATAVSSPVTTLLVVGPDGVVTHIGGALRPSTAAKWVGLPLERVLPLSSQTAFRDALQTVQQEGGNRFLHWHSKSAAFPGDTATPGRRQAFVCRPADATGAGTITILLGHAPPAAAMPEPTPTPTPTPTPAADAGDAALHAQLDHVQRQLMQSEKMAAVGQLAAGVAHEINNPVGFVFSNLGTLAGYVRDLLKLTDAIDSATDIVQLREAKAAIDYVYIRDDIESLIAESEDGIDRIRRIITALKDFSHQDAEEYQAADINRAIETTLRVVNAELKYKAEVVTELGDLPEVECVASQIKQVVLNLLVNAAHAMESFGRIVVRSGVKGGLAWFEVEDNGCGMSPEVQIRIFEPFYTTKPIGTGTGLGLSLSYNIVEKHHGRIELHSRPGEGTRFRVWLPVQQHESAD